MEPAVRITIGWQPPKPALSEVEWAEGFGDGFPMGAYDYR
jgi:hypothetical protein